jgi:hypothetical protein
MARTACSEAETLPLDAHTVIASLVSPWIGVFGELWLVYLQVFLGTLFVDPLTIGLIVLAGGVLILSEMIPVHHPLAGVTAGMIWAVGLFGLAIGVFAMALAPLVAENLWRSYPAPINSDLTFDQNGLFGQLQILIVMLVSILPLWSAVRVLRRSVVFSRLVRERQKLVLLSWQLLLGLGLMTATAIAMRWAVKEPVRSCGAVLLLEEGYASALVSRFADWILSGCNLIMAPQLAH